MSLARAASGITGEPSSVASISAGARKERAEVHAKYEKEFADLRRQLHVSDD